VVQHIIITCDMCIYLPRSIIQQHCDPRVEK